jgi:hypothetical protein
LARIESDANAMPVRSALPAIAVNTPVVRESFFTAEHLLISRGLFLFNEWTGDVIEPSSEGDPLLGIRLSG